MPRDEVSRTANVERNGGQKWVKSLCFWGWRAFNSCQATTASRMINCTPDCCRNCRRGRYALKFISRIVIIFNQTENVLAGNFTLLFILKLLTGNNKSVSDYISSRLLNSVSYDAGSRLWTITNLVNSWAMCRTVGYLLVNVWTHIITWQLISFYIKYTYRVSHKSHPSRFINKWKKKVNFRYEKIN